MWFISFLPFQFFFYVRVGQNFSFDWLFGSVLGSTRPRACARSFGTHSGTNNKCAFKAMGRRVVVLIRCPCISVQPATLSNVSREAESYVKWIACHLSNKWKKNQSQTIFWVQARVQICIVISVSKCFQGSRTKWRGGNVKDGVGMPRMEDWALDCQIILIIFFAAFV